MIINWPLIEIFRETRTGNNLYQELSFQDSEALGDVDEGADITGNIFWTWNKKYYECALSQKTKILNSYSIWKIHAKVECDVSIFLWNTTKP